MSSTDVEALDKLLRSHGNVDDVELKTTLTRLAAAIRHRLEVGSSESMDFVVAAGRSLCRIKGTTHAALVMDALCNCGQLLYSNERSAEALKTAARFEELARRTGNQDLLARAQNQIGILHAELGNIGDSVISFSKSLTLARARNDLLREVSVLNGIGCAYNYGGLFRHAIPCFERNLEICRTAEYAKVGATAPLRTEYPRAALTNKAQSHLALEEFEQGFAAIEQALHDSPEPWDGLSRERRVMREVTFVKLALDLRKIALAREHVDVVHRYASAATDRARFYGKSIAAIYQVRAEDPDSGLQALENLRAKARTSTERMTILADLVKSYEYLGRNEPALERTRELVACMRTMREAGLAAVLSTDIEHSAATGDSAFDAVPVVAREALLRAKISESRLLGERAQMLERLATAADLKEEESGQHGYRVGRLAALLAERLHWNADKREALDAGARLHDIGKIAMPDRILSSANALEDSQRVFMSMHTTVGAELLSKGQDPAMQMAEEIARHHHEWWDGTGYPSKLSGKRIPIHARIVALADVFDALTHGRPYSPPWSIDRALAEIQSKRGTQFDPDLTDTFLALIGDLRREHADLNAFLAQAGRDSPLLQARDKIRSMLDGGRKAEGLMRAAAEETVH